MKPVAAGCDKFGLHEDVEHLIAASNVQADKQLVNPYCFTAAIAPHIAAQQEQVTIDLRHIVKSYTALAEQVDRVIVEGAGGFVVPLNDDEDSADLAVRLGLSIILVVGLRLGCLNHALLTAQVIAARGLVLAGWVANCVDENMAMLDENIAALQQRITAPMLGVVPYQAQPDAKVAATFLHLNLLNGALAHG
jgi:dethiobiotin synthetase